MGKQVFISYSKADSEHANKLVAALNDLGVSHFIDKEHLEWGTPVLPKIRSALKKSESIIVIITSNSLESKWVFLEVGFAIAYKKDVFPYFIDSDLIGKLPTFLQQYQYKVGLEAVKKHFSTQRLREKILKAAILSILFLLGYVFFNFLFEDQKASQSAPKPLDAAHRSSLIAGDSLFQLGQLPAAKEVYGQVLSFNPTLQSVRDQLLECERLLIKGKALDLSTTAPDRIFARGEFERALRGYKNLLEKSPATNPRILIRIEQCEAILSLIEKRKTTLPTNMVLVPGGKFRMGTEDEEAEIEVHSFLMDVTEVTVAEYQRFLNATKYESPETWESQLKKPKRPVVFVKWDDANAYALWAGKRLPTEAEWEYAARGGYTGIGGRPKLEYPWEESTSVNLANFDAHDLRGSDWSNADRFLKEVASFSANGFGLFEISGNVQEWCNDWYTSNYLRYAIRKNPQGSPRPKESYDLDKVVRGGSWYNGTARLRCANREYEDFDESNSYTGFRCVKDINGE